MIASEKRHPGRGGKFCDAAVDIERMVREGLWEEVTFEQRPAWSKGMSYEMIQEEDVFRQNVGDTIDRFSNFEYVNLDSWS